MLDKQFFNSCDFSVAEKTNILSDIYEVRYYIVQEKMPEGSLDAPFFGAVCRLFKNNEEIFQWKSIYGISRTSQIIKHTNGKSYLIFTEDLYGYSVLELETLKSIHYLPECSYREGEDFDETFIWIEMFYNSYNNMLAVSGCIWAAPYSVVLVDFSDPLKIVTAKNWFDIRMPIDPNYMKYGHIDFKEWDKDRLICISENGEEIMIDCNSINS